MRGGAEILVNTCARIKKNENVVVVTDEEHFNLSQVLTERCVEAGGQTVIILSPERSIDNEEPAPAIAAAMEKADVVFLPVTHALAHTRAVREAIKKNARVISMTAFTERMMCSGGLFTDFQKRKPLCENLAARLTNTSIVKVTNPSGTNLLLSVAGRDGNSHSCILRKPGFTAVPNIEANISPLEGAAEGVLVADGSIPYYGIGILAEPVVFEIHKGFVSKIQGGKQAKVLCDLLAAQNDPYVYNIAQFAIGLNPDCVEFTGEMLHDEGVNGTIHIGIGTSANLGGKTCAKTHFDAIIKNPSVWFDRDLIINSGEMNC